MTTHTFEPTVLADTGRKTRRTTAALFIVGGLLMAAGGNLHPLGSGDTVDAHLLSMFASPGWNLAHVILVAGAVVSSCAFVSAWRTTAFGPSVQSWLLVTLLAWGLGAVDSVPHLLAAADAHALAQHEVTPVLGLHMLLEVIAGPAVGLTGAFVAIVVARAARTKVAWVLAAFAVVGGLLSGAAAPLVIGLDDPHFTVLFPFQAGSAVWLVGTGIRLVRR